MAELAVRDLVVEYVHDGYAVRPIDELSFEADAGELVVLLGPSGCGKTTLLSCLGGILTPTSGSITVGGIKVSSLRGRELDAYRREQIGFVFQAFNLIPSLSARENIAVPLMLTGHAKSAAFGRADELLELVDLTDRAHYRPARLSGGQQQRVAVARGLGHDPRVLLADEPTANLDHIQAEAVITLLRDLRTAGRLIVVSTHDARLVPIADRIIKMVPDAIDDAGGPRLLDVAAGATVFEQGDPSDVVYVIESGSIDIVRILADGGEQSLATLGAGRYFGELGPLLGYQRSATARAASDVTLTAYGAREFRQRVLHDG
ncbi:MAG: ATP-binding cassette domain-containing protein [Ilumatobacteraceae bacterium]